MLVVSAHDLISTCQLNLSPKNRSYISQSNSYNTRVRPTTVLSACNNNSTVEHNFIASRNLVVYCNFDVMKAYMKEGGVV